MHLVHYMEIMTVIYLASISVTICTGQDNVLVIPNGGGASLICPKTPEVTLIQWLKFNATEKVTEKTYSDGPSVNQEVSEHLRLSIPVLNETHYILQIMNVQYTDAGHFRCIRMLKDQISHYDLRLQVVYETTTNSITRYSEESTTLSETTQDFYATNTKVQDWTSRNDTYSVVNYTLAFILLGIACAFAITVILMVIRMYVLQRKVMENIKRQRNITDIPQSSSSRPEELYLDTETPIRESRPTSERGRRRQTINNVIYSSIEEEIEASLQAEPSINDMSNKYEPLTHNQLQNSHVYKDIS